MLYIYLYIYIYTYMYIVICNIYHKLVISSEFIQKMKKNDISAEKTPSYMSGVHAYMYIHVVTLQYLPFIVLTGALAHSVVYLPYIFPAIQTAYSGLATLNAHRATKNTGIARSLERIEVQYIMIMVM